MPQIDGRIPLQKQRDSAPKSYSSGEWSWSMYFYAHLQKEIDRLTNSFDQAGWHSFFSWSGFEFEPSWRNDFGLADVSDVDIVEHSSGYMITVESSGFSQSDVDITFVSRTPVIKGQKKGTRKRGTRNFVDRSSTAERLNVTSGYTTTWTNTASPLGLTATYSPLSCQKGRTAKRLEESVTIIAGCFSASRHSESS